MRQVIVQVYGDPEVVRNDMANITENFKTIYDEMVSEIAETASEVCKKELIMNLGVKATDEEDLYPGTNVTLAVDSVSDLPEGNDLLRPVVFNLGVSGRCLGCRYDRLFYDDEPYGIFEESPADCPRPAPNRTEFIERFFEKLQLDDNLRNMTKVLDMDYMGEGCDKSTVVPISAKVKVTFSTNEPNADLTEDEEVLAVAFGRAYNLANFYSSTTQAFFPDLCDLSYRHIQAGGVKVTVKGQTATFSITGKCRGCCEPLAEGRESLFFGKKGDGDSANQVGNMEVVGSTDPAAERALAKEVSENSTDRAFDCFCARPKTNHTRPKKWDRPPTSEEFMEAFKERIRYFKEAEMLTRVTGVKKVTMEGFSCHAGMDSTGMDSTGMDSTDVEEEL